jgi:hypothetical protein
LSAGARTVDPFFLSTAVGLTTLANIANVALHTVRLAHLEDTEKLLVTIQAKIFAERADACFSVRSLEVQADLLTRATEAFVKFTGAQVSEALYPLTKSHGKLAFGSTANATAAKAIASDVAQISKSLNVVNSHLRRAMAAAVQSACHSAASGEIIIQADVEELSKQIEEAESELMSASLHLISDFMGGVLTGVFDPTEPVDIDLADEIERGKVLLASLSSLGTLSDDQWETPKGISETTWNYLVEGVSVMWGAACAISVYTKDNAVVDALVQFDFMVESIYKLVTAKSSNELDIAVEVLNLVSSALRLINFIVSFMSGEANPGVLYVTLTVQTLSSIVRLARTSIMLEREQGQQREMIAQAQSTKNEATLLRSFGTCNALGTAWKLSGTAGAFMKEAEAAGAISLQDLDKGILTRVYERYVEERPSLAAKVLRKGLSLGAPGVTEELIRKADALANVAPITDFAIASDRQQVKALGALGFQPVTTDSSKARFLICRGCGDSIITAMKVVVDDEMFKGLEKNFSNAPEHFGDLHMPSDSTLNFVQLPREEGFSMLAFAKVPRAALATHALPVLFDLREGIFSTEAPKLEKNASEIFREKAMAILKRNDVEVLSWKTTHTGIDGWKNGMLNGVYCDDHPNKLEFASLDILAGRFLQASPDDIAKEAHLRSLVPDGLFQQGRYLTVTKGCGCRMGRLGNPYRALDNVAKWWMAIDDDDDMFQTQRCHWRYDIWISVEPLTDVDPIHDDNATELGCEISYSSKKLREPVGDLSQLVFAIGYDGVKRTHWAWQHNDFLGVGTQFPGSKLLYNSEEAQVGPAGKPSAMDDDGCSAHTSFQVWSKPPATLESSKGTVNKSRFTGQNMVTDFQKHLSSVLCSTRCAFKDTVDLPQALGRILSLATPGGIGTDPQPRFVPRQRGTSESCDHVKEMLMPEGFPKDMASFVRSGLGQLTTNPEMRWPLFGRIERIYKEDCDFEATLLLDPAPCAAGYMPDLRLTPKGIVEETCVPSTIGSAGVAPLHRYAVAWDLSHHDKSKLRWEETQVEKGMLKAGFSRWGAEVLLESDTLNTDLFFWRRSLRQRIFVQRDPRVTTASGAAVCGLWPDLPVDLPIPMF